MFDARRNCRPVCRAAAPGRTARPPAAQPAVPAAAARSQVDETAVVAPHQASGSIAGRTQPDGPLQHRRGGPDRMVPVDLAEHHVSGEDHQLGGGPALVGDRQRRRRSRRGRGLPAAAPGRSGGRRARRHGGCRGPGSPSCRRRSAPRAATAGSGPPDRSAVPATSAATRLGIDAPVAAEHVAPTRRSAGCPPAATHAGAVRAAPCLPAGGR